MRAYRASIIAAPVSGITAGVTDLFEPAYDWMTPDRLAFAHVLSVGNGDMWGPGSKCPVVVDQVIAFEQRHVMHNFSVEEQGVFHERIIVPFKAVCAVVEHKCLFAVGQWMCLRPDPEAVKARLRPSGQIILPGGNDVVQNQTAVTNLAFGRVASVGNGIEVKGGFSRPDCKPGDLVGFYDVMASCYNSFGQPMAFVPWSEAVIGLE